MLGDRLGLVDGIKIDIEEVTELGFWDGKLLGTALGAITTWYI